ncbi:MAG: rod shape-determining protein MreC [Pseudomonadota bacterium]|nr:rod shape-determining protein MreC [Pseudomonadota bacterium]
MEQNLFSREPLGVRALTLALIAAMLLMVSDWQHPEWFNPLRQQMHAAFNPIYHLANYPVLSAKWLSQQAKSEDVLRRENTAMQAELLQANVRLQKLAELSAENARLRGLLDTPLIIDGRLLIAEIIGTDTNPLRHILVINRGAKDRVFVGQTVLDNHGVMGQVLEVYPHSARVLLLSDKEHSASVRVERTGMRAILTGTGDSSSLLLEYVPNTADIEVGDHLITSGLGERFPAGYPIGMVSDVQRPGSQEFADIRVTPTAQLEGSHHVVLLFSKPLARVQPNEQP